MFEVQNAMDLNYSQIVNDIYVGEMRHGSTHRQIDFLKEMSDIFCMFSKLKSNENLDLNTFSYAAQIAAVTMDPWLISKIQNPVEKVQIAAVSEASQVLKFISEPSENVKVAAVSCNGYAIDDFENPSERIQLAAVRQWPYAIEYIKNPGEKVQLAAVKKWYHAIKYISHPTDKVRKYVEEIKISIKKSDVK